MIRLLRMLQRRRFQLCRQLINFLSGICELPLESLSISLNLQQLVSGDITVVAKLLPTSGSLIKRYT
jgi:hypothetical protein